MPIKVSSESGAYDPSPAQLWNQDAQASTTVGTSLFRLNTSSLGSLYTVSGDSPSLSYGTLRNYIMPNGLDFFLTEGLVYFHHIIDTGDSPWVSGTITPGEFGTTPTLLSIPVCGLGQGPDLGVATNLGSVSNWTATGAWCSSGPSNGTSYGSPGGTQAVKSTKLVPSEGRDASGRVGGYPELFCVDSTTNAVMVQLLSGSRDPRVGERLSWTTNLITSFTNATGAVSAYRFQPSYSVQRSNRTYSATVVEFYKMNSLGYHMLQLNGNIRFTADQTVTIGDLKFKVLAGGGIPTRAALFGRWEFDQKEVYWVKMKANDDYLSQGKIVAGSKDRETSQNFTLQKDVDAVLSGKELNTSQKSEASKILGSVGGSINDFKSTDFKFESNPVTSLHKDFILDAFPEKQGTISYQESQTRNNFVEIETTNEKVDGRTTASSQAIQHLNAAGVPSANYTTLLGSSNTKTTVDAPQKLPTGNDLIKKNDQFLDKVTENIDKTNVTTKNLAIDGLNSVSKVNEDLNKRSGSEINSSYDSFKTKIYGPVKRFDLVPVYKHPEYTTLQRYDPDGRVDRTFTFNFTLDMENQTCGPCTCIEVTTPGEPTGEVDPETGDPILGEGTTEIITCSSATSPSDLSFTVKKVILNNLTPEANIWKQICKNYAGSLQGVVYEDLAGRNTGTSDPSNAKEGDTYYNKNTSKTRIYANGKWQNADEADLSFKKDTKDPIQKLDEQPIKKKGEMDKILDDMTFQTENGVKLKAKGSDFTRDFAKDTLQSLEDNAKAFNKEADKINNQKD